MNPVTIVAGFFCGVRQHVSQLLDKTPVPPFQRYGEKCQLSIHTDPVPSL
jgi:hypothetical protein